MEVVAPCQPGNLACNRSSTLAMLLAVTEVWRYKRGYAGYQPIWGGDRGFTNPRAPLL